LRLPARVSKRLGDLSQFPDTPDLRTLPIIVRNVFSIDPGARTLRL